MTPPCIDSPARARTSAVCSSNASCLVGGADLPGRFEIDRMENVKKEKVDESGQ